MRLRGRVDWAVVLLAALAVSGLAATILMQAGPLVSDRGPVEVSYPAGEVREVRVLGAVDMHVDGESKPGASVIGAIALFMLATATLTTAVVLRIVGARRRLTSFWLIAAAGLAVAGADELFAIHETVGHNLPQLADVPGVKRPDDLLMMLYLPAALAFVWWFRDVLREHRPTFLCMVAAVAWFGLSAMSDVISLQLEEWFELLAGLFVAAGLIALMHRHLTQHLQIRIESMRPAGVRAEALPRPTRAAPVPR